MMGEWVGGGRGGGEQRALCTCKQLLIHFETATRVVGPVIREVLSTRTAKELCVLVRLGGCRKRSRHRGRETRRVASQMGTGRRRWRRGSLLEMCHVAVGVEGLTNLALRVTRVFVAVSFP